MAQSRLRVVGLGAVSLCMLASSVAMPTAATARATRPIARDATGAVPLAHACVPPGRDGARASRVAWRALKNPIFELPHMTKDQTIRLIDGRWHLWFSERPEESGTAPTGHWVSRDLSNWSAEGVVPQWGSPDITRARGGPYVLTFQLRDATNPEISRIHYATSADPDGPWSEPKPLVPELFPGERLIDAAIAHTESGLALMFKRGLHTGSEQHDEVAWSPSGSLDGPWQYLGEPDLPRVENFQFLPIDGRWHVLATTIPLHQPALYQLTGDPSVAESWLHWKRTKIFDVPEEQWNSAPGSPGLTHEKANSAYLCDARHLDGYWYLFYAGSDELRTNQGRGLAKIGVARSKNLERWAVPAGR